MKFRSAAVESSAPHADPSHKHQPACDWLGYLQPSENLGDDNLTLQRSRQERDIIVQTMERIKYPHGFHTNLLRARLLLHALLQSVWS